jgi:hypothetical protein
LDWQAGLRDHSFLDHMDLALIRNTLRSRHHAQSSI